MLCNLIKCRYYSFGNAWLLNAIVKFACHSKIFKSFKEHTARGYVNRKQKLIWNLCIHAFLNRPHFMLPPNNYEPCKYLNIFLLLFWNVLPVYICNVHIHMYIKAPNVLRRTNPTSACRLFLDHFLISKSTFSSNLMFFWPCIIV